jgi:hypothetical protein
MTRHSLDCFAIDTLINVDRNNNSISDQGNNSDCNNIENNEINECVICFEPVIDLCEVSKFGCVHAKYMHVNCVKSLRKCPLCRERSVIVESSIRHRDTMACEHYVICFLLGFGFLFLLFSAIYPMIFFKTGGYNAIKNNSTITNTTLK